MFVSYLSSSLVYVLASWLLLIRPGSLKKALPIISLFQRRQTGAQSQQEADDEGQPFQPEQCPQLEFPSYTTFRQEHALRLGAIIGELRSRDTIDITAGDRIQSLIDEAAMLLNMENSKVSIETLDELERRVKEQLEQGVIHEGRVLSFLNVAFLVAAIGVAFTAWPALQLVAKRFPTIKNIIKLILPPALTYITIHFTSTPHLAPEVLPKFLPRLLAVFGSLLGAGILGIGLLDTFRSLSSRKLESLLACFSLMQASALLPLSWVYRLEFLGVFFGFCVYLGVWFLTEALLVPKTQEPLLSYPFMVAPLVVLALKSAVRFAASRDVIDDKPPKLQASVLNLGLNIFGRIALNFWAFFESQRSEPSLLRNILYLVFIGAQSVVGIAMKERGLYLTSTTFFAIWGIWKVTEIDKGRELIIFAICSSLLALIVACRKHPRMTAAFGQGLLRE